MKKLLIGLTLAALAASAVLAAAPATASSSAQGNVIDTRLYILIHSLGLSKIDTLTNPGTLLLVK